MTDPTLLGMPLEMQQQIIEHVDDSDLLELRRVCKELNAAAHDTFSKAYLTYQRCFILDPAQLLRLGNILFTPRLASRVKRIDLTLRAVDTSKPMSIVANKGVSSAFAEHEWCEAYSAVRYAELAGPDCLNWAIIGSILDAISRLPSVQWFTMAFRPERSAYHALSAHYPHFSQDFLELAKTTRALSKLRLLSLPGSYQVTEDGLLGPNAWSEEAMAPALEGLMFLCECPEEAVAQFPGMLSILSSASRLAAWSFAIGNTARLDAVSKLFRPPPSFWCTGTLDCLTHLHFGGMLVDSSKDMLNVLVRCSSTLQYLSLHVICIDEYGEPWKPIFRQALTMPHLEDIDFGHLSQRSFILLHSTVYMFNSQYQKDHPKNYRVLSEQGQTNARLALENGLKHGMLHHPLL